MIRGQLAVSNPKLLSLPHSGKNQARYMSSLTEEIIQKERKHGAYNYHPVPVVLNRGQRTRVWDVEGREYLDFLAGYSALNQGHCHPKILTAMTEQAARLTLTSRGFHTDKLHAFQRKLCEMFGYERCLPMNTGVEGGDTSIKLARRWGYDVKKIPQDRARVVFARNNFWGRSIAAVSSSTDPVCREGFGPFVPGFDLVDYDNVEQVERAVSKPDVCAFMVEPIQGEAGVIVPKEGYLRKVKDICEKYNVLLICDEVQTGLGRTGKMLCSDWDNVKPDLVVLGKALSGGCYPISAVLGSDEVLGLLKPGEHGSTYGGNPLACAIGTAALDVLVEENLCENAIKMGELLRNGLRKRSKLVETVRGRGLMNALVVKDVLGDGRTAWEVCLETARNGVLAKPTHGDTIRLAPPLCIEKDEIDVAVGVIRDALRVVAERADSAVSDTAA